MYYHSKPKFNGVQEIIYNQNGAYAINLDEFKSTGTHWIALYKNGKDRITSFNVIYFGSFGVENMTKEIKKLIRKKNIITNIYKIQAYNLIMCGYCCIGFINFMVKCKNVLDYTNF